MLCRLKDFENHPIGAADGTIGHVKDFYFQDVDWAVHFFLVDAGSWFSRRKVLIPPSAVEQAKRREHALPSATSRKPVRATPSVAADTPASRPIEQPYLGYYGRPYYWNDLAMWGEGLDSSATARGQAGFMGQRGGRGHDRPALRREERGYPGKLDPHLRSGKLVTGFQVHAAGGEIGQVSDFLADDETWAIRYLVVDAGNWWTGHKILIAPTWIQRVDWAQRAVSVDLSRESIKNAPTFDATGFAGREAQGNLHHYQGRSGD